ncbi:MAG: metallopeptidase TldD-related protein [Firmicutes bacterium]|nr:metallopeptidase TldD-related protein [Bacillota bacterium]
MISYIKEILNKLDINNYRIVINSIYYKNIKLKDSKIEKEKKKIKLYHIYFGYQAGIAYIITPDCEKMIIERIIIDYISDKRKYIYKNIDLCDYQKMININKVNDQKICLHNKNEKEILNDKNDFFNVNKNYQFIESNHIYICHEIELISKDTYFKTINTKNYNMLTVFSESSIPLTFLNAYAIINPKNNIFKELIEKTNSQIKITNDYEVSNLKGNVLFPAPLFKIICSLLLNCLNGRYIQRGDVFIKIHHFNEKIVKNNINIIDNPFFDFGSNENIKIDSEGSIMKIKNIIDNGIFKESLNDIYSATLLNQDAGNSHLNYMTNMLEIQPTVVEFYFDKKECKVYNCNVIIKQINNDFLNFNLENGIINLSLLGFDIKSNEYFNYNIDLNILEFFGKIIDTQGIHSKIDNYYICDVILEFN